jgi:hypothetical protein
MKAVFFIVSLGSLVIAGPVRAENVQYTMKAGDTLIGIGQKYFINGQAVAKVQTLNRIANPYKIAVGKTVSIPTDLLRARPVTAQIASFSGDAFVNGSRAKVGQALAEGQVIQTGQGGFLTFVIEGGSRTTLPSRSRVRIARLREYLLTKGRDVELSVEAGRTETHAAPAPNPQSRFRIRTPVAVSAVRGTVFRIGFDGVDKPSLTEVVEGKVAVDGAEDQPSSLVPGGFGAAVPKAGPIAQEKLLPSPQLDPKSQLQTQEALKFAFMPVVGASSYHLQMARDAGFVDIVAEADTQSPMGQFESLPNGTYFVRSMAVAQSGLFGLADAFSFKRQLASVSGSFENAGPDQYRFKWLGTAGKRNVFHFQLFAKGNTTVPLVDEPGLEKQGLTLTNLPSGAYEWRVGMRQYNDDLVIETWMPLQKVSVGK